MNNTESLQYSESLKKFESTINLLNDNKLNKNNAFEYRIIDEINILFLDSSLFTKEKENLWQKYSLAISSIGKIYGYCVEYIHGEFISFLAGLKLSMPISSSSFKDDKREKSQTDTLRKEDILDKNDTIIINEDYNYFKNLTIKASKGNESNIGLLNYLQVNSSLDLELGQENSCEKISDFAEEINIENFITFSLNEIEQAELFNNEIINKHHNDNIIERVYSNPESPEPQDLSVDNITESASSLSNKLENIEFFDDFNYIKPKERTKISSLKEFSRKKKMNKHPDVFILNEDNIQYDIQPCECMISSQLLSKWKKEAPEININQQIFSNISFFCLNTRQFTMIQRSLQNIKIQSSQDNELEILNIEQNQLSDDTNKNFNFMNIREVKKKILAYISAINGLFNYELNDLKEKTINNINNSLFFAAILHICNDFGFELKTIDNCLYLIVR